MWVLMANGRWPMAGHEPGGSQRSEIRSSRILKFSIRQLPNPQSAVGLLYHPSLAICSHPILIKRLDLPQHLLLETLACGVDQNFLTDPFDKLLKLGFVYTNSGTTE